MHYHTWLSIEILCVKQNRAWLVHTYRTMHYSFPSHSFCVLRGEPGFIHTHSTRYRTQTLSPISESDWRFSGTRTISPSYSGLQHKMNIKATTICGGWSMQVLLEKNLGISSNDLKLSLWRIRSGSKEMREVETLLNSILIQSQQSFWCSQVRTKYLVFSKCSSVFMSPAIYRLWMDLADTSPYIFYMSGQWI